MFTHYFLAVCLSAVALWSADGNVVRTSDQDPLLSSVRLVPDQAKQRVSRHVRDVRAVSNLTINIVKA